eukprot:scaffold224102_cov34-Prasinocladus_malaysianus.AAC.1
MGACETQHASVAVGGAVEVEEDTLDSIKRTIPTDVSGCTLAMAEGGGGDGKDHYLEFELGSGGAAQESAAGGGLVGLKVAVGERQGAAANGKLVVEDCPA